MVLASPGWRGRCAARPWGGGEEWSTGAARVTELARWQAAGKLERGAGDGAAIVAPGGSRHGELSTGMLFMAKL